MSKFLKLFSIILIVFSLIINFYSVYASDINMNLTADNSTASTSNDASANKTATNETATDGQPITSQEPTTSASLDDTIAPASITSATEDGFGLSNILNVLLITVGIILILLAIAIIIRLK